MPDALTNEILALIMDGERRAATDLVVQWAEAHSDERAVTDVLEPVLAKFGEMWSSLDNISLGQGYIAGKVAEDLMEGAVAARTMEAVAAQTKGPVVIGNPKIVPRATARNIVVPFMRKAFQQVAGPIILQHGGAVINPMLDLLAGLPNVVAFCVDSQDDLDQSRKIIGPGPTLMGQIDGPNLHTQNAADVQQQCLSILRNRCDDPHFLLATSGSDIDLATPPETICAIGEAVQQFSGEGAQ